MNRKIYQTIRFAERHPVRQLAFVLATQGAMLAAATLIEGEPEKLAIVLMMFVTVITALFVSRPFALLSGLVCAATIDASYVFPTGQSLISLESLGLIALSCLFTEGTVLLAGAFRDAFVRAEKARQIAEDAVRTREEVLSIVAHDLRQPLGAILLGTGAAAKAIGDPENPARAAAYLATVRNCADRLSRMIEDLLDFARIDSGQLAVKPERFDLAPLLRDVAAQARLTAPDRPVEVREPESVPVFADPLRVRQIVGNLVSNAVKYGKPKSPIEIEAEVTGEAVRVSVGNLGAGIPPDQIPTLFERFSRTDEARASGVKGIGLGLYITRGLVVAQGGEIWAESQPNARTAFHFTLQKEAHG